MTNEKLEELARTVLSALDKVCGLERAEEYYIYCEAKCLAHAVLQYLGKE